MSLNPAFDSVEKPLLDSSGDLDSFSDIGSFGDFDPFGGLDDSILAPYLSDQLDLVDSVEANAPIAHSRAERSSTYSDSDSPDYNPGMNNPAELVPPSLVSGTLMTKL